MISEDVQIALDGAADYGEEVYPSTFEPPCDAYGTLPGGATYFRASSTDGSGIHADLHFSPAKRGCKHSFPLEFFQNVTNQPIFGNGTQCDRQVRLFNSSLSDAPYEPRYVKGKVSTNLPPLGDSKWLGEVEGIQIDTAFIEYNWLDCQTLKGYSGTGPGD